jgi:hypothetical protein
MLLLPGRMSLVRGLARSQAQVQRRDVALGVIPVVEPRRIHVGQLLGALGNKQNARSFRRGGKVVFIRDVRSQQRPSWEQVIGSAKADAGSRAPGIAWSAGEQIVRRAVFWRNSRHRTVRRHRQPRVEAWSTCRKDLTKSSRVGSESAAGSAVQEPQTKPPSTFLQRSCSRELRQQMIRGKIDCPAGLC